jgi:VanZ family protein
MGGGRNSGSERFAWIHSTRLHVVLYSLLLVFTPFIILQRNLMEVIAKASTSTFPLGALRVPVVPVAAAFLLLGAGVVFRRFLTRRLLVAVAVVALLDALAQEITDYYFDQKFYDLLQNWHYLAYALFAVVMFWDLAPRKVRPAKILWITFGLALVYSVFDEGFQRFMSSRVFDLCDNAKDAWGCAMGMTLLLMGGKRFDELIEGWHKLRSVPPSAHFANPLATLFFILVFNFILLCCSSLLCDATYVWIAAGLTFAIFLVFLAAYFLLFRRWGRIVVAAAALALVGPVGYGVARHHSEQIVLNRDGLTVYKGIPIPIFDVMIYPDGRFRLVDRKHTFTPRDQKLMLKQKADIILVGSGAVGHGGLGFPETSMVQFLYNPNLDRATQVIILRTPEACTVFNRLKREGKRVLFIIHNTC